MRHERALHAPSQTAALDPEDLVADGELGDGRSDGLDLAGELHPDDPLPRPEEAREAADEERLRGAQAAVGPGDGRGVHPDDELVVLRDRRVDVFDAKDVR
jgi:hypothetical protein